MNYLSIEQVLDVHALMVERYGGTLGVRDRGALESAVHQPMMAFGGVDLYPTPAAKTATLCFSIVANHPFLDGNKRTGFMAMYVFLKANGFPLDVDTDEAERVILAVADGTMDRDGLTEWVAGRLER